MPRADVMIVGVPSLRVRKRQPMAKVRKFAVAAWPQHQVPMVGHQRVREQPHARNVLQGFAEYPLKRFVVAILEENGTPAIAPIEDMVNIPAQGSAKRSAHDPQSLPTVGPSVKPIWVLTPFLPPFLPRYPLFGPLFLPFNYRAISIPGIACSSSATPAEVTVVPPSVISLRFPKPTRCLIPASEIFVPRSPRPSRVFREARCANPA